MNDLERGEVLVPIAGWEDLYAVTNMGRVWAYPRSWTSSHGNRLGHQGRWLYQGDCHGYKTATFCRNGRVSYFRVARLVITAFIAPKPNARMQINHKNGVKHDNRAENLEWVTPSENSKHAYRMGLRKPESFDSLRRNLAKAVPAAIVAHMKLNREQVAEIIAKYAAGNTSHLKLGVEYGVSRSTIRSAVSGNYFVKAESVQIIADRMARIGIKAVA